MFGNMKALWLWFNYWNEHKNHYSSGDVARMVNGVFEADCCQIIKMFGWSRNDPSKVPTKQQSCPNYNKDGILDETISSWYTKATKKGTLATLPTTGYCLVYIDGGHVGIYNASTGETYEMCAGSVMGIRKQKINKNYWNKWSDLYWCPDYSEPATSNPVIATTPSATEDYSKNTVADRFKVVKDGKQIGSYTKFAGACKTADANNAIVTDGKGGAQIYPELITSTPASVGLVAGKKIMLNNTPVYNSESGPSIGARTGYYYVWSAEVSKGRVRMTNSSTRVGKAGQVSFFVDEEICN